MLEIFAVIMLANANKRNALARGRKPGWFIAMTYLFWFGLEIVGLFIGISLGLGYVTYVIALGMAGIGGLVSYLAAKNCAPGGYYPSQPMPYAPAPGYGGPVMQPGPPPAEPLDEPAELEIVREADLRGDMTSWTFVLNNETVGSLGNGASRRVMTAQRQNMLQAVGEYGRASLPMYFNVEHGGHARIVFRTDRFVPEECSGISPPAFTQHAAPVPPYGQPGI